MSRPKMTQPTLGELTGGHETIGLHNIHEVLGEKMPEMPMNRVGRLRLLNALQDRFGMNFRNIPGVMDTISDFDKHIADHEVISKNKESQDGG